MYSSIHSAAGAARFVSPNAPGADAGDRAESVLLPALLDELDTGIVVCTAEGMVKTANWAARQELATGRWLKAPRGMLGTDLMAGLGEALVAAAHRGRRQLLVLVSGDERLPVSVSPLDAAGAEPQVLVMLGRRTPCSRLGLELLASRHRLTDAERRVLAGLAGGGTPKQLSAAHGVALSTVRTQVKSLHAKLGINSNDALLRLIASVPALASALRVLTAPAQTSREPHPSGAREWAA